MKKKIIIFLSLTLFLSLGVASIVSAQVASSPNTGTIPAFNYNQTNPPSVSTVPATRENTPSWISLQRYLKIVIANGVSLINTRITSLSYAKRQVLTSKLNSDQKTLLATSTIGGLIGELQALKAKIQADTDITIARKDVDSIYTSFSIYGVSIPRINLMRNIYIQQNFLDSLNTVFAQTQARIDKDVANCKNVTATQKALNDAKAIVNTGIGNTLGTILESVSNLEPADYGTTSSQVINNANSVLKGVRAKFLSIRTLLIKANAKTASKCTRMQTCTNGQCVDKCPDKTCTYYGQKGCGDAAGAYWSCAYNKLGCLVPMPKTCASGQTCTSGRCVAPTCSFTYSNWSTCTASGVQTRTVTAKTPTGCTGGTPAALTQKCTPTCSFTYSSWSACTADGVQTRTVTAKTPYNCTGGTEVLTQHCTPGGGTCQNKCDPLTSVKTCLPSSSPASTFVSYCKKSDDGCYYMYEETCPTGTACRSGACVATSTPGTSCLGRGEHSNTLGAQCCSDTTAILQLKQDYYVTDNPYFTCCAAGECAQDGVCKPGGTVVTGTIAQCVNGSWIRSSLTCTGDLTLKKDFFDSTAYPPACCAPSACLESGVCKASGQSVSNYPDIVCHDGVWPTSYYSWYY